jgi:SHS2 domain-containing protein
VPAAYRLVDHTADLAFEVQAPSWPALLAAATAALGDLILSDDGGGAGVAREVAVVGADREDVLVAWLQAALLAYEESGVVPRGARIEAADERQARGTLLGLATDPATRHPDRVVKAVTYHDLRVVPGAAARPWRVVVVLDL